MVLTYGKTVELQNKKLSCLFGVYFFLLFVTISVICLWGDVLHLNDVGTASSTGLLVHVSLHVPVASQQELLAASLASNPARYQTLCEEAGETVDGCFSAAASCAGASSVCLTTGATSFTMGAKEVFIATKYALEQSGEDGRQTWLLTTADAQSVILKYGIEYDDKDDWQIMKETLFREPEVKRQSLATRVHEDTALTVVLDANDAVVKRTLPSVAMQDHGILFTFEDLLVLSGTVSSSDRGAWRDIWLSGAELGLKVSCIAHAAGDDVESDDLWDGPVCYIRVLRHEIQRTASVSSRHYASMTLVNNSQGVLEERQLNSYLTGVQLKAEISWTSTYFSPNRATLVLVVFCLLLYMGKASIRLLALYGLGRLSIVYKEALCPRFSIFGEVAEATAEAVVNGAAYREMDGDGSLDSTGSLPLSSIEQHVEQLIRALHPQWTEEQLYKFTTLAVLSLLPREPGFYMPRRWQRCMQRFMFCQRVDDHQQDGFLEIVHVDRFIAATTQQQESRVKALGDLFRRRPCRWFSLERYFLPREVSKRQWSSEELSPHEVSRSDLSSTGVSAAEIMGAPRGEKAFGTDRLGSMELLNRLSSALGSGPGSVDGESMWSPKDLNSVAIADNERGSRKGGKSRRGSASQQTTAGQHDDGEGGVLVDLTTNLRDHLKRPASLVQISTRFFAQQLADYDKRLVRVLSKVEETHQTTVTFWRTKTQLLSDQLDRMESELKEFLESHPQFEPGEDIPIEQVALNRGLSAPSSAASMSLATGRFTLKSSGGSSMDLGWTKSVHLTGFDTQSVHLGRFPFKEEDDPAALRTADSAASLPDPAASKPPTQSAPAEMVPSLPQDLSIVPSDPGARAATAEENMQLDPEALARGVSAPPAASAPSPSPRQSVHKFQIDHLQEMMQIIASRVADMEQTMGIGTGAAEDEQQQGKGRRARFMWKT